MVHTPDLKLVAARALNRLAVSPGELSDSLPSGLQGKTPANRTGQLLTM